MSLVWKLLRRHVSVAQLAGFFLANLLGMLIVLLSIQFYLDLRPVFSQDGGAIKSDYLILSKRLGGMGEGSTFSPTELKDIQAQRFVRAAGAFTASQYKVDCSLAVAGGASFGTQMYFESVPDAFVSEPTSEWFFNPDRPVVPIILPRNYLAIYNFGFAQSRALPRISEGMVSMVDINVRLRGNGLDEVIRGRVVGFSSRINTILVPESFMLWSNQRYAPQEDASPTRLILDVSNPADDAIPQYVKAHGYDVDEDKLDAGKMMYFLRMVSGIVMSVGLLISVLSFYILMLSVYLLVQKNTKKLQNLLLIGYSPTRVALPYQTLTVGVNLLVLVLALSLLMLCREAYMDRLWRMFPMVSEGVLWPTVCLGISLFFLAGCFNVMAIKRKIMNIWNRKV